MSDKMASGKFRGAGEEEGGEQVEGRCLVRAIWLVALVAVGQVLFVAEPTGAMQIGHPLNRVSRAIGGNNRTWRIQEFGWMYLLFRNPDEKYKAPMDGYITGYAVELAHNVFLANSKAVERASVMNKLNNEIRWEVLGMRRANKKTYLDPNESVWSVGHPFGVFRELLSLNWDFKIYVSDFVSGGEGKRFPRWQDWRNERYQICFVYAYSVVDWPEIQNFASDWGLPPYPQAIDDPNSPLPYFHTNETRYFSRWPVRQIGYCDDKTGECKMEFDDRDYHHVEDNNPNKYYARRAKWCDTWQDTGAPVMCNWSKRPFISPPSDNWGIHTTNFEVNDLKLTYVIPGRTSNTSAKSECHQNFIAYDLLGYRGVVEQALDSLKKERERARRKRGGASRAKLL